MILLPIIILLVVGGGLVVANSEGIIDIPALDFVGGVPSTIPDLPFDTDVDIEGTVTSGTGTLKEEVTGIVTDTDIESLDNPLGTTNQELETLNDAGFDTLDKTLDLAFSLHGLSSAAVDAGSPTDLPSWVISLIAGGLTLILLFSITKKLGKHLVMVIGLALLLVLALMVVQMN